MGRVKRSDGLGVRMSEHNATVAEVQDYIPKAEPKNFDDSKHLTIDEIAKQSQVLITQELQAIRTLLQKENS